MNNIENIQFEERNVYPAVTWGIISGIFLGILTYLLNGNSSLITYHNSILRFGLIATYVAVNIAIVVWVVNIANKLNRSPIVWGFFSFLFPQMTLIVIGFQDYKIEDKRIKQIVDELRLDFNSEYLHIKSTKDLSEAELNEVELKLKEKFSQKLKDRISDFRFKERTESGNMTEQEKKEEQKRIEAEEDEVVQSVSDQHWTGEKNKCPACGAAMGDNITTCAECGLTINSTV